MTIFESITFLQCEADFEPLPNGELTNIANLCFGAGPGGGDYRSYQLGKINEFEWNLWIDFGFGNELRRLYSLAAIAKTKDSISAEIVAIELLKLHLIEEKENNIFCTNFNEVTLEGSGLLTKNQVLNILKMLPSEE